MKTVIQTWCRPYLSDRTSATRCIRRFLRTTRFGRKWRPVRPAKIVYRSRTATELTARMLRRILGRAYIRSYHAVLKREEKTAVEEWFFESNNGILTTTCAYGLIVD